MIKNNQIFNNLFDAHVITPTRLLAFGWFVHSALTEANTNGQYTDIIAQLLMVLTALKKEINDVDGNLTSQVNNTKNVNLLIDAFSIFMRDNEYVIARAVGGRDSDAYRTFYPKGKSEYSLANKTTMPTLSARVRNAATRYAPQLGTELSTELQAFEPDFTNAVTAQHMQKKAVKNDRTNRHTAFTQAQWTLTGAVHAVAAANIGNPAACTGMFPFDMLFPQTKHKRLQLTGKLAQNEVKELLNRTLTTRVSLTIRNTGDNASFVVWLAASAADGAPATAKEVKAGDTLIIKADKLGNLNNTFLMIKNVNAVNEGAYDIEIAGLKKSSDITTQEAIEMEVVRA